MFGRRTSNASSGIGSGVDVGDVAAAQGGSGSGSSDSDWPDDMSDKESLQSWAKEQQEKEEDDDGLISSKEQQDLRKWFLVITLLLLLLGVGVSVATFYYLNGQQQNTFQRAVSFVQIPSDTLLFL